MKKAIRTNVFADWLANVGDVRAISKIATRIDRLCLGNPGDVKPVGEGISEMRIDYGPGYRVYYSQRGIEIVILLCGGSKGSQKADIAKAKEINAELKRTK